MRKGNPRIVLDLIEGGEGRGGEEGRDEGVGEGGRGCRAGLEEEAEAGGEVGARTETPIL